MGSSNIARLRARVLVVGLVVGSSRETAAQATPVLESYRGERPADADRVLQPLRDRLERRGAAVDAARAVARLGDRLPLPGTTDPDLSAAALAERVDLGYRAALRGDYRLAVVQLDAALAAARANPAQVVADGGAPAWLTRALAGLAFAHGRLGDPDAAAAAMAEQVRSFPDHPITRDAFGPEAVQLYAAARAALHAAPRGTLRVDTGRADARVAINEAVRGHGAALEAALAPGTYRVLVEAGGVARRYTAAVAAGARTDLAIDWATDAHLTATPRWLGFVWPGGAPDLSGRFAERFARGGPADDAIVVELPPPGARRVVVGRIYRRRTGALARAGAIELGGGPVRDPARLAALADYLASGERAPDVVAVPRAEPITTTARRPGRSRAPAWIAAGTAVAAAGTGAYLIAIHGRGTCGARAPVQCPLVRDTRALGWTLAGGGLAAAGLAVHWHRRF